MSFLKIEIFYVFFKDFIYLFFWEGKGVRKGEKHQWEVSFWVPPTGDLQLGHNPGMYLLGIEPVTLLFPVWHSIHWATPAKANYWVLNTKSLPLAGVAQWIKCQPANGKVAGWIPSQGICLCCRPGPLLGVYKEQLIGVFLTCWYFSPSFPLSLKNKYNLLKNCHI